MWSEFSNSKYLSAGDFAHREERKLTVESIRSELVGRDRDKMPVAYFKEHGAKPLVLNRTNQRQLGICGPTLESCNGAFVVLHVIDTEYGGEATRGIRIKDVVPPPSSGLAPNTKQRAQGQTAAQAMDDDDIPFAPEWR